MDTDPEPLVEETSWPVQGLRVAARVHGPADGRRVLALHGWQDSAASFDRLAPLLPGCRVVAVDLLGHGRSAWRPAGACYSFLEWVADLDELLDRIGWDRCAVLGHSLGAGIGTAFAGTWPERVERLAWIDGFSPGVSPIDEAPERLRLFAERRRTRRANRVFSDAEAAAARLAERLEMTVEAARVLCTRSTIACDDGVTWACDPKVRDGPPLRLSREHVLAFLRRVSCPVHFVRPTRGWPYPEDVVAALPQLVAGPFSLERLEGGHHVHLERPDAVAALLREFLAGPPSAGA